MSSKPTSTMTRIQTPAKARLRKLAPRLGMNQTKALTRAVELLEAEVKGKRDLAAVGAGSVGEAEAVTR